LSWLILVTKDGSIKYPSSHESSSNFCPNISTLAPDVLESSNNSHTKLYCSLLFNGPIVVSGCIPFPTTIRSNSFFNFSTSSSYLDSCTYIRLIAEQTCPVERKTPIVIFLMELLSNSASERTSAG